MSDRKTDYTALFLMAIEEDSIDNYGEKQSLKEFHLLGREYNRLSSEMFAEFRGEIQSSAEYKQKRNERMRHLSNQLRVLQKSYTILNILKRHNVKDVYNVTEEEYDQFKRRQLLDFIEGKSNKINLF